MLIDHLVKHLSVFIVLLLSEAELLICLHRLLVVFPAIDPTVSKQVHLPRLHFALKASDLCDDYLNPLRVLGQEVLQEDQLELNPGLILVQVLCVQVSFMH